MLTLEAPARSALQRLFAACLEQDCTLCGVESGALLCRECAHTLPTALAACTRCAIALESPGVCGRCLREPPRFDEAIAAFDYRFPVDRLVQRFKYTGDLAIGRWLAGALADRARGEPRPDLLVAPPSTRERLRRRGFNPALEIAKAVGRSLGIACAIEGLTRVRETTPQPGLGRRDRERNLEGAMGSRLALVGRHVVLVDDVMTTGATANAAAKVLRQRGAARVSTWVVARTPESRGWPPRGQG